MLTQVQKQEPGDASMQNATQLRASAELYLKIARRLSDRNARDQLHAIVAEILVHAVELESQSGPPLSKSSGMTERQREARDFAANNPKKVIQTLRNRIPNHRVIQTKIGQELRALYRLPHEVPHRILTLLMQLNGQKQTPPGGTSR
jgi:hypothetical protein